MTAQSPTVERMYSPMSRRDLMSTPWNGSSRISTRHFSSSHRATITFCWFPPERLSMGAASPAHLIPIERTISPARSRSSPWRMIPARLKRRRKGKVMFSRMEKSRMTALLARSSGTRWIPASTASRMDRPVYSSPSRRIFPASGSRMPKSASATSVFPAPMRPVTPSTSPA